MPPIEAASLTNLTTTKVVLPPQKTELEAAFRSAIERGHDLSVILDEIGEQVEVLADAHQHLMARIDAWGSVLRRRH